MNKVMLIGNVGADPQVKYLDQGVCVAQVRLATTEKGYTLQNGTQVPDRTEWHNCIFWRKQAEAVEKYVHKGDKLYVEGKIQTRDWTNRQGITQKTIDIMVESMEFLSPKGHNQQNQAQAQAAEPAQPATPAVVTPSENDGDYPF